jgi:O-acetyl-ADP-ribose deacetylase (regulator of RNase III)
VCRTPVKWEHAAGVVLMDFEYKGKTLRLVQGDITRITVDAIVNAANSGLRGGGGVDGAIHRAGGSSIMAECRKIGGCPTGQAVITGGGNLPAKHVIHTVGPIWYGGKSGESDLLRKAYENGLALAEGHGLKSIAFPSISTGVYGFPIEEAAPIAIKTVLEHLGGKTSLQEAQFVLFSEGDYQLYVERVKAALRARH